MAALVAGVVTIRIKHKDGSTTELRTSAEEVVIETDGQTRVDVKELDPSGPGQNPLPAPISARATLSAMALQFDGVDDYVHVPSLEFQGAPLTLEAWITPDRVAAQYARSGIIGWDWRVRLSIDTKDDGVTLCCQVWTVDHGSPVTPTVYWQPRTAGGQMEHVAMVLEDKTFQIFRDGQPNARAPFPIVGYRVAVSAGHSMSHFALGAGLPSKIRDREPSEFFTGTIHAARVSNSIRYQKAFTPSLLSSDAETMALYDFAQGSGDVLKDVSGHGHDGKIFGATWVRLATGDSGAAD